MFYAVSYTHLNSQTPREPKIPGMPGGKKPTRTGWLYFILACALLGYAFFNTVSYTHLQATVYQKHRTLQKPQGDV